MPDFLKEMTDDALKAMAARAGARPEDVPSREAALAVIAESVKKRLESLSAAELREKLAECDVQAPKGKKRKDLIDALVSDEAGFCMAVGEYFPADDLVGIEADLKDIGKDIQRTVVDVRAAGLLFDEELAAIRSALAQRAGQPASLRAADEAANMAMTQLNQGDMDGGMASLSQAMALADRSVADFQGAMLARALLAAMDTVAFCKMAESNSGETEKELHDALRAHRGGLPAARDRAVALLDKCVKIYREELVALQSVLQTKQIFVQNMKAQGVDVFNAERFLRRASDALGQKSCRDATEYLARAERSAVESRQGWLEQVRGRLPQVEATVQEAKGLGADVGEAERLIEQAKVALESSDYSLCAELVKRGEQRAIEAQRMQVQKAEELRRRQLQAAQESLVTSTQSVTEARAFNIEGWQALDMKVREAQEALMRSDAFGATTAAKEAGDLARQMQQAIEEGRKGADALQVQYTGPCPRCNQMAVKALQTGFGRCASCGFVYPFQFQQQPQRQEKRGFGIFKR
ncbi:MAG: hypothetical protein HZB92_08250 [Euryarchaeota archaeon]|nr:hypothetical protein [Euryarchaeota archaeon]